MSLDLARLVCKDLPQTSDLQKFQTWEEKEEVLQDGSTSCSASIVIARWLRTCGLCDTLFFTQNPSCHASKCIQQYTPHV